MFIWHWYLHYKDEIEEIQIIFFFSKVFSAFYPLSQTCIHRLWSTTTQSEAQEIRKWQKHGKLLNLLKIHVKTLLIISQNFYAKTFLTLPKAAITIRSMTPERWLRFLIIETLIPKFIFATKQFTMLIMNIT